MSGATFKRRFTFTEIEQITGVDRATLLTFVQHEWVLPAGEREMDDEDLARIELIQDLRIRLGANDDAIPVILHLIDQLCYLRGRMSRATKPGA